MGIKFLSSPPSKNKYKKYASGEQSVTSTGVSFKMADGTVFATYGLQISGLAFIPKKLTLIGKNTGNVIEYNVDFLLYGSRHIMYIPVAFAIDFSGKIFQETSPAIIGSTCNLPVPYNEIHNWIAEE
jgi:hypothetical protein